MSSSRQKEAKKLDTPDLYIIVYEYSHMLYFLLYLEYLK